MKRRHLHKKLYLLPVLLLVLINVSCRKATNESTAPEEKKKTKIATPIDFDIDRIKKRGKLIAIVENSSTSYFLYKGQPMGYEYELLHLLAQELDVTLELNITTDIDLAFEKLNKGEGDIIAFNLTVTKKRAKKVLFTNHHSTGRQVLVQRKPTGWRQLKLHQIERSLIRNPIELAGKEVYVRKSSAFVSRLENLSEEIGGDIIIVQDYGNVDTDELIKKVASGEIDYTVADEDIAWINSVNYPNIDTKTPISFPQKIAWAVRSNSTGLQKGVNQWLGKIKRKPDYNLIYKKYFRDLKASYNRAHSEFASFNEGDVSPYDNAIKEAAAKIGWDWKLLASVIYQESRFDPKAKSWAGAVGLMQLIPETAQIYGAPDPYSPIQSITAGTNYLQWLNNLWEKKVPDKEERVKFILASYNIGQGHILDAYRLAKKYEQDPTLWEGGVEKFLTLKSNPKYFNDPVVTSGYCIGKETVKYVREILFRYDQYKQLLAYN